MTAAARLAIETLRLGRFRSHVSAVVPAEGRTVALFGPNGAGKTNLLEAASLLVPGRGLRRAEPAAFARQPEDAGWRVRAAITGPEGAHEIVTGADPGQGARRMVEIDGKQAAQTALGRLLAMVWLTPAMDGLWTEAAGARRRFLDRMTMGFVPEHAQVAIDYEKAMRGRNRLLRDGTQDPAWLSGLEEQMGRLGARIARNRAGALARIAAAAGSAEAGSAFPRPALEIDGELEVRLAGLDGEAAEAAEAEEAAALARRLADGRREDAAAGRARAGPHRSDLRARYAAKDMPAGLCSTGEQKALLISLCLANARALATATGAAPVLLLDEVAAHLDADRRTALFAEIAGLGAQAWLTGTGPEQFEGLADALRLRVSERDGVSAIAPAD